MGNPSAVPRSHGFQERAQSSPRHPERSAHRLDGFRRMETAGRDIERFAYCENAHGERRHFHPVQEIRHAESQPRLPRKLVDADEAEAEADEQAGETPERRCPEGRRDGDEGQHHQREIIRRTEADGEIHQPRREKGDPQRRNRSGNERADRGGRQRRSAAPALGHLVAFDDGGERGAFTRRVEQDRRRRAAIHAAIIDAGEHDERARRIEFVCHRQEQRDRERRSYARQHADRRAQEHADRGEHQVHRLHRDGEALQEGRETFHCHSP